MGAENCIRQLAVLQRQIDRPQLTDTDRPFLAALLHPPISQHIDGGAVDQQIVTHRSSLLDPAMKRFSTARTKSASLVPAGVRP